MSLHQLSWTSDHPSNLNFRDVSCLCGNTICNCPSNLFCFDFGHESRVCENSHSESVVIDTSHSDKDASCSYVGKYVVVKYDGTPYPGLVIDEDEEEVHVKCMYRVGKNRFVWPKIDDMLWYAQEQVLMVIPEPLPVTKRHLQVEPSLWDQVLDLID